MLKAIKTGEKFNNGWLEWGSYSTTPNQREEIKAVRDDYTRDLTRITAPGTKTRIDFKTLPCSLDVKIAIQAFFMDAEEDALQRKIQMEYWNDEENCYKTSYFYRDDITFNAKKATETNIEYEGFDIILVEY